jgi:raffinose/stachyose/melibiose transport system permease protein
MRMRWNVALAFLAPALALYGLFALYPAFRGIGYAFTDFYGVGVPKFVGLENFQRILADARAITSIKNTLIYALVVSVVQNVLGIALAVWMGNLPTVRNFSRVALFTPSMMSGVAVAFIWTYIYSPLGGLLNTVLAAVGLGGLQRVWLGDPATALFAVAAVNVWMYVGQTSAIYLANYLSIPQELKDSAIIDGANGWQRFFFIELPLLAPATTISVTLSLIGGLRVFDLIFLLTQGGPGNASEVLGFVIYKEAFTGQRFGYAAALATVLSIFILVLTALQTRILRAREGNT